MSPAVALLVALIGTGGVVSSIVAFRKLTPERESILLTAAHGAVIIQTTIIDELQEHVGDLERRMDRRDAELAAVIRDRDRYRDERNQAREEVRELREVNEDLRERVVTLEGRVEELEHRE